jgi:hypothetical protein
MTSEAHAPGELSSGMRVRGSWRCVSGSAFTMGYKWDRSGARGAIVGVSACEGALKSGDRASELLSLFVCLVESKEAGSDTRSYSLCGVGWVRTGLLVMASMSNRSVVLRKVRCDQN